MDHSQYTRWRDFAVRMARTYHHRNAAFRKRLEACVVDFVDRYTSGGTDIAGIESWDHGKNGCGYACDYATEFARDMEDWYGAPRYHYDDGRDGPTAAFRRWEERVVAPFECCVRAGLDMAAEPSAGVAGFTVGDLRRMYPEGVPEWILAAFAPRKGRALSRRQWDRSPDSAGVWL